LSIENKNNKFLVIVYIGEDNSIINSLKDINAEIYIFNNCKKAKKQIPILMGKINAILFDKKGSASLNDCINFFNSYKKDSSHQELKIVRIILSEKDKSPVELRYLLNEGFDDFFRKPVSVHTLINRINILIELKKQIITEKENSGKESLKNQIHKYKIPVLKRIIDILFSSILLIAVSPILLITIIAIRAESKGKILYISRRVGSGYKIFNFYKFRSMYTGADNQLKNLANLNEYNEHEESENNSEDIIAPGIKNKGKGGRILLSDDMEIGEREYLNKKGKTIKTAFKKIKYDPRVTKVGKIIRKFSIDELPQLFNILKGDMSVVGNRPLPLYEAELLTTDDWSTRFLGPSGVTGLWQITKNKENMSPEERKKLDNQYSKISGSSYWFFYDIWIMLKTIPAMLQKGEK